MNTAEGVYFTNSFHRGVDAMGLRFHIRIESHSRGRGHEKDLGAPLTFLLVDKDAKLLQDKTVGELDLEPLIVGCKSSFNNDHGTLEFTNEQVDDVIDQKSCV